MSRHWASKMASTPKMQQFLIYHFNLPLCIKKTFTTHLPRKHSTEISGLCPRSGRDDAEISRSVSRASAEISGGGAHDAKISRFCPRSGRDCAAVSRLFPRVSAKISRKLGTLNETQILHCSKYPAFQRGAPPLWSSRYGICVY